MGELDERRWAVVSERGREAAGLTYAEAVEIEHGLKGEKVRGLCVVTDAAAGLLSPAKREAGAAGAGGPRGLGDDGAGPQRRPARRRGGA